MKHHLNNTKELTIIAEDIANKLSPGDILLLSGELGSGKTTFVQYLGKALGILEDITSPTFTIVGEYEIKERAGLKWLVHIDLYRIPGEEENVDSKYLKEIIETAKKEKRIVVIEWPERLPSIVPKKAWKLAFEHGQQENTRVLTIQAP